MDLELKNAIEKESLRQKEHLELIASENYVSRDVREAAGSILTNKYAEGYPGKRYYGGCEYVDVVESLAIERLKKLFGSEEANVQAHCGSSANMAVYFSQLKAGDTILGMSLAHGGHLTHGSPVNFSGKLFNVVSYGVRESDQRIDYDSIETLIKNHTPKMVVAGASSYPREIDFQKIGQVCQKYGIFFLVDMAHIAGLVATGLHQSPIPYADAVTSTTHKTLRGPRSGIIMMKSAHAKTINSMIFPGIQGGPLMHIIAAKAVAFQEALQPTFKDYGMQVVKNAKALAESLKGLGWELVTGGTDNHIVLCDLRRHGVTGKDVEEFCNRAGLTINKNAIPFDPLPPGKASGIRLGSPALTTRGLKEKDFEKIAGFLDRAVRDLKAGVSPEGLHKEVVAFSTQFMVP